MAAINSEKLGIDPLFMAITLFRHRRFEDCLEICDQLLIKNPKDQAAWLLKARAITEQTYIDEIEVEEEGIAESLMDDNTIADTARPGTSLRKRSTGTGSGGKGTSQGIRPVSQSGRPLTGFIRPGTQSGPMATMEQAIKAPRTSATARPITSASGRFIRLGTASMMTEPGGPFIDVSKLNFAVYSKRPALAKVLFEYLFHHESNVRSATELARYCNQTTKYGNWWWKVQLGKCYYRLGLYREAEGQFLSSMKSTKYPRPSTRTGGGSGDSSSEYLETVDMYLYLCKVYIKLDQPLKALEFYEKGLKVFPKDASLLTGIARIHEGLDNTEESISYYREVLKTDSTSVEAIACIATHHFYSDQPEIALSYYRRLLQMGIYNAELFNNLGLCCYYSQQYDLCLSSFQKALAIASDETLADVWYNIAHVAIGIGDTRLAYQCLKLALIHNNAHSEAYNNLGVLEWQRQRGEKALGCFQSSIKHAPSLYEPHYNTALASQRIGRLQESYTSVKQSLDSFPDHVDSKELLKDLQHHFEAL